MNVPTALLETMLEDVSRQKEAELKRQRSELEKNIQTLTNAIPEEIGDLWDELAPYTSKPEWGREDYGVFVRMRVDGEPLLLEPFYIFSRDTRYNRGVHLSVYQSGSNYTPVAQLEDFLFERREAYPAWRAKKIEKATRALREKLYYTGTKGVKTEAEAEEVLAKLIELAPENEEEWRRNFEGWQKQYEFNQDLAERQKQEEQRKQTAIAEYRQAYAAYLAVYRSAVEKNQKALQVLQERLEQPYELWELQYSLKYEEDGEYEFSTEKVFVLKDRPDQAGYWQVFRWGNVKRMRYMNVVSITGPLTFTPGQAADGSVSGACKSHFIERAGKSVYTSPAVTDLVEYMAGLEFVEVPERPNAPSFLYGWEIDNIEAEVRGEDFDF